MTCHQGEHVIMSFWVTLQHPTLLNDEDNILIDVI